MNLSSFPPITLRQPVLSFGIGVRFDCAGRLVQYGCRQVVIVSSASVAAAAQELAARLGQSGVTSEVLLGVPPEPDVPAFERLQRQMPAQVDAVVGLGGGSVLDVAKLLAALHGRSEPVSRYFGSGLLPDRAAKLVCLPTTAGTGSEVSPNAVLYDPVDRLKKAVISSHLVPDAAFVDPDLTATAPAALTAATGIDALVHCLEAYANRFAHPLIDLYALEGIRLIAAHLPRAVRNGTDLEARSAVALGSLYGGLCLGPVNTAAVHALSYPLGSEFRLAHGLANALLVAHVVRFNLPAAPERYAAIAIALGAHSGGSPLEGAAAGVRKLEELCAACNLPRGLSAVGVPTSAIPQLAAAAMKVTRLLKNNPRQITAADAEQIYRAAW